MFLGNSGPCELVEAESEAQLVRCTALRRRTRCFNGSTDKRRSGREGDGLRCRSAAATTDSDPSYQRRKLDERNDINCEG
ncbi:unnamed protein product [Pieris brassicae]|uniref:Uncharacterized protein n=1 Tax=Pieris brassicae TaxID=7116 RepID=A0A9P0T1S0_PIEBR|nr:unnamed protein product [Pieris brassicae]